MLGAGRELHVGQGQAMFHVHAISGLKCCVNRLQNSDFIILFVRTSSLVFQALVYCYMIVGATIPPHLM